MTQTEKLEFIGLAIETVQGFITSTPDEDHCGDYEYLDLLRGLQLDELKGVCTQSEFTQGECVQGEHSLAESTSKQTMKDLYEVLTEAHDHAHDRAMHYILSNIYDENYIVPKEIHKDEILDFIEYTYNLEGINTLH